MKRYAYIISIIMLVLSLALGCFAASNSKPTTHHETVGAEQLKGEYGQFGHTYTLGKVDPWNITLNSAEYSVDTLRIGDVIYYPSGEEKLLVLHFTVHNPQKQEALMRFDTFSITAVDASSTNWESIGEIGSDEKNSKGEPTFARVDQEMKPAQKMDIYTAIIVPASGELPKLIVKSTDELVIRYDLRGKVKAIPAPYADPSDKIGATALATVPAVSGTYYPTGQLSVKFDSASYSDKAINEQELEDGARFLLVKMTAKNISKSKPLLRFDTFQTKVTDTDGVSIEGGNDLLRASNDGNVDMELEVGQEVNFRFYFYIEKGVTPKTISISESESGRYYQFELPQ